MPEIFNEYYEVVGLFDEGLSGASKGEGSEIRLNLAWWDLGKLNYDIKKRRKHLQKRWRNEHAGTMLTKW